MYIVKVIVEYSFTDDEVESEDEARLFALEDYLCGIEPKFCTEVERIEENGSN